jgi:hypothetical protein
MAFHINIHDNLYKYSWQYVYSETSQIRPSENRPSLSIGRFFTSMPNISLARKYNNTSNPSKPAFVIAEVDLEGAAPLPLHEILFRILGKG